MSGANETLLTLPGTLSVPTISSTPASKMRFSASPISKPWTHAAENMFSALFAEDFCCAHNGAAGADDVVEDYDGLVLYI